MITLVLVGIIVVQGHLRSSQCYKKSESDCQRPTCVWMGDVCQINGYQIISLLMKVEDEKSASTEVLSYKSDQDSCQDYSYCEMSEEEEEEVSTYSYYSEEETQDLDLYWDSTSSQQNTSDSSEFQEWYEETIYTYEYEELPEETEPEISEELNSQDDSNQDSPKSRSHEHEISAEKLAWNKRTINIT